MTQPKAMLDAAEVDHGRADASTSVCEQEISISPSKTVASTGDAAASTIPAREDVLPSSNVVEPDIEKGTEAIPLETKSGSLDKRPSLKDQTNLLPLKQILVVFLGCALSLMLSMLDQTIVSNLLPSLASDFNAGRSITWVATAYMLSSTAFLPVVGRLSDIFGRKRTMLMSIALFQVGSIAVSVSQSINQMIAFRAIQGLGGGAILTLVMIIVSDVVSLKDRGLYQSVLSVFVALSNGMGPLIGGAIVENTTWRWAFWINIPLGVIAFLVIMFFLPLKHVKGSVKTKLQQIDWGGCALVICSSTLIVLALQWAGATHPWDSAYVLAPLIIGLAFLAAFLIYEWKIPAYPVVPVRLFRTVALGTCWLITVTNGAIYYIQLFYLPQYFQILKGAGPIRSGILMFPLILTMVAISSVSGIWVAKTGKYKWNITLGWALWSVATGLLALLDQNSSTGTIVGYLLFAGIGCGQTFQTTLVAIQAAVDRKDMAVATSLRNFIRMLGGTIALATAQTILSGVLKSRSTLNSDLLGQVLDNPLSIYSASSTLTPEQLQSIRSAYRDGFRVVWIVCAVLGALSTIVAALFLKNVSLQRGDEAEQKAKSQAWLEARKERRRKQSQS